MKDLITVGPDGTAEGTGPRRPAGPPPARLDEGMCTR